MTPLETHLIAQIDRQRDFFWHRLRFDAVARFLPRERPFRLLDVGAGAGIFAHHLARRFPLAEYCFIEPLASLERHLCARFGADRNLRERARLDGVAVVTLLDVLEHQDDDVRFLADLVARLDGGCRVLITVPALPALWSSWDEALGHRRRYRQGSLAAAVRGAGLELEDVHYLFPEMVPLALVRRWRRTGADPAAEFPALPGWMNEVLYRLGRTSLALGHVPLGTSVLAVARKPA